MKTLTIAGLATALTLTAFAPQAEAATQITLVNETVTDGNSATFDLNGDDIADIEARIDVFPGIFIEDMQVESEFVNALLFGLTTPTGALEVTDPGFAVATATRTTFVPPDQGFGVQTFANGDEISSTTSGLPVVQLYTEQNGQVIIIESTAPNEGPLIPLEPVGGDLLPETGASAVLGFIIETGVAEFVTGETDNELFFNGFLDETETRTFGFLEVTRGSIIVGTTGYNPTGGAAVVSQTGMAPVPLPASALLLLAGLGGLGVMRRRR